MQSVIKALWKNQRSNTEEMKRHTFKSIHLKSYITCHGRLYNVYSVTFSEQNQFIFVSHLYIKENFGAFFGKI